MVTQMNWEMPADAANVSLCRRAVRLLLEHNSISESDVDDAELVLGELCSNVVRHAYKARDGSLAVRMALDGEDLQLSVSDSGCGFDAAPQPAPVFSEAGGMGIYLMERFSDHVQIEAVSPRGSSVTATRHLTRQAAPSLPGTP